MGTALRLSFVLGFAAAATGCISTPRQTDSAAVAVGTRAAQHAAAMQGKPYRYGGNTPAGFDCSGLVQYSYAQAGARLPRSTEGLWDISRTVSLRAIRAGDLLFFTQAGKRSSHVALYLGSDRFVHAPSSGKNVSVANMTDAYWQRHFEGARRLRLD
jgi:murein DD-endopeptidase